MYANYVNAILVACIQIVAFDKSFTCNHDCINTQTGQEEIWPSGRSERNQIGKSKKRNEPKTMKISTRKMGNREIATE